MLSDPEVESAVLISSDEGASFEKHPINFNILSLLFHPAQENWILAYSHDSKVKGRNPSVRKCGFYNLAMYSWDVVWYHFHLAALQFNGFRKKMAVCSRKCHARKILLVRFNTNLWKVCPAQRHNIILFLLNAIRIQAFCGSPPRCFCVTIWLVGIQFQLHLKYIKHQRLEVIQPFSVIVELYGHQSSNWVL